MKLKLSPYLIITILINLLLSSCSHRDEEGTEPRAMYYWNTRFELDSTKLSFMDRHKIGKLYIRYFDVVLNGGCQPNGTILFDSIATCPAEVVPVVYIHNDCMREPEEGLAEKIVNRVMQMSETHGIQGVKEIQIDCDWTETTKENFFDFLSEFRTLAQLRGVGTSTTIRLHQLNMEAPPADRGTLMVYNTGDLRRLDKEKPILDINDVKPYLKYLKKYPLPLTAAYPIYRWELLFRNGKFVDIIHNRDEIPILKSDSIVVREVSSAEILAAKKAIEKERPECREGIILFDLNNYNINRYNDEEFETFYN